MFRRVAIFIFTVYLIAGITMIVVVAGVNNINLRCSSDIYKTMTVPSVYKPIEFVLDKLF